MTLPPCEVAFLNHCTNKIVDIFYSVFPRMYLNGLVTDLFYQYYCLRLNRVYTEITAIFKKAVHSDDPLESFQYQNHE